jgi:hypothetical protein
MSATDEPIISHHSRCLDAWESGTTTEEKWHSVARIGAECALIGDRTVRMIPWPTGGQCIYTFRVEKNNDFLWYYGFYPRLGNTFLFPDGRVIRDNRKDYFEKLTEFWDACKEAGLVIPEGEAHPDLAD